jgi:nucleotide-binding universal stress UspA family protein
MFNLRKILFPVDLSERASGASHYLKMLSAAFGAEVEVLHVLEPPEAMSGSPEFSAGMVIATWDRYKEQATTRLEAFVASELQGLKVRTAIVKGDPAGRIVEHAHQGKADLIVMPTHGYGPFRKFLLGSVTAKVLHDVECPVWTGAHMEEAPAPDSMAMKRVLCALDLGDRSKAALEWAVEFAEAFGARITAVHAIPTPEASSAAYSYDPEFGQRLRETAGQALDDLLDEAGVEAETVLEPGAPAKVIRAAAEQTNADLVVIGRAAGGLLGRLRANAYDIIRHSACPVVSV